MEYAVYPAAYLNPLRFGRFVYCEDGAPPLDMFGVYVLWNGTPVEALTARGFTLERHGCFEVLWR